MSSDGLTVALSDGASVSYDPAPWANLLVRRFVEEPQVSRRWLNSVANVYQSSYDRETMEWMQQAAFDRGSFATLLGVQCAEDGSFVRVFAAGDTVLVFLDNDDITLTIPYLRPEEFDASPHLLSTNIVHNRDWDDETLAHAYRDIHTASHEEPRLLAMTDALGRWLLDYPNAESIATLTTIPDEDAFRLFVEDERNAGRMKRDDTTLVVIE